MKFNLKQMGGLNIKRTKIIDELDESMNNKSEYYNKDILENPKEKEEEEMQRQRDSWINTL